MLDQEARSRLQRSKSDNLVDFIGAAAPIGPAGPSVSIKNAARKLL